MIFEKKRVGGKNINYFDNIYPCAILPLLVGRGCVPPTRSPSEQCAAGRDEDPVFGSRYGSGALGERPVKDIQNTI